jgi:hypothetical protein
MKFRYTLAVSGIVFAGLGNSSATAADDELIRRFRSQYPAAVQRLESVVANIDCEATRHASRRRDGLETLVETGSIRFCVFGNSRLHSIVYTRRKPVAEVSAVLRAFTPDMYFELWKPVGGEHWLIQEVSRDKGRRQVAEFRQWVELDPFVRGAFQAGDVPVSALLTDSALKILQARSWIADDGNERVELYVSTDPESESWIGKEYRDGRLTLAPDLDWALVGYQWNCRRPEGVRSKRHGEIRCRRWDDETVFPTYVEERLDIRAEHHVEQVWQVTFHSVSRGTADKRNFRLTTYGLPDVTKSVTNESVPLPADTVDLGDIAMSQKLTVRFEIRNRTVLPVRLIGAQLTCGADGCVEAITSRLPATIDPLGVGELALRFKAPATSGAFSKDVSVFTDASGHPMLRLTVKGRVTETAASANLANDAVSNTN